jgi:hypothetical protein
MHVKSSRIDVYIAGWFASRRLRLNASKTEIEWFGSRAKLQNIAGQNLTLTIGTEAVEPESAGRVLYVLMVQ